MQVPDGSEPHGSSPYMPESPDLQLEQQGSRKSGISIKQCK